MSSFESETNMEVAKDESRNTDNLDPENFLKKAGILEVMQHRPISPLKGYVLKEEVYTD